MAFRVEENYKKDYITQAWVNFKYKFCPSGLDFGPQRFAAAGP